jgi:arabinose-5-phosphate isomerase
MVGNLDSFLANTADFVLNTSVEVEACPNNLAPTTSTTAQLLMGDALAVSLLKCRNFSSEDFGKFHPGGALGKRLYLTVAEIAEKNSKPSVSTDTPMKEVLVEISRHRMGATAVFEKDKLAGIITDGDLRRMLEHKDEFNNLLARDIMASDPLVIDMSELAVKAMEMMRLKKVSQLIVTDGADYKGIVHLHDLYREGIN